MTLSEEDIVQIKEIINDAIRWHDHERAVALKKHMEDVFKNQIGENPAGQPSGTKHAGGFSHEGTCPDCI